MKALKRQLSTLRIFSACRQFADAPELRLYYLSLAALNCLPKGRLWRKWKATLQFKRFQRRLPDPTSQLFNDYLFRMKTSSALESPLRVLVTDKEFLKLFVKGAVGDEYNVRSFAVLHDFDELAAYHFPDRCCIKATHGSGQVVLRRSGEALDREAIGRWLQNSHYIRSGELNYRTLQPKIIVEELAFDSDNVVEYKIFCFNGTPRAILVVLNRFHGIQRLVFDCDWRRADVRFRSSTGHEDTCSRPATLTKMKDLAGRLSAFFEGLVRIDLYTDGEQVLVSEITNCHQGANETFFSNEDERRLSEMLFDGGQ